MIGNLAESFAVQLFLTANGPAGGVRNNTRRRGMRGKVTSARRAASQTCGE